MSITLHDHPDGEGRIEFDDVVIVTNDCDATVTRVLIGTDGMRKLAYKLYALADLLDGGRQ